MTDLSKPQWVNRFRARQFIQACLFALSGLLAAVGNLLFWLWSPEYHLWVRLLGVGVILALILALVVVGVRYAYQ